MTRRMGPNVDLNAELRREGGVVVVSFAGDIDVMSAPALRETIIKVVAAGHHYLVCDLTSVGFLDSTGLGVLVGRLKAIRMVGGDIRLVLGSERIRRSFKITGLDTIFAIDDCVSDAIGAMQQQVPA